MLELAAESGCTMLSIGFELISRATLKACTSTSTGRRPSPRLVEKVHSYGIMVFGLFMFGFDGDDPAVFDETVKFNIDANYDACAYSVLTPYPGTLTWYEMKKENRIVSFDWTKYDQGHVVYRPAQMSGEDLRRGTAAAYEDFYSISSMARRFPLRGKRHRTQWAIYNLFMNKGAQLQKSKKSQRQPPRRRSANAADPTDQARVARGRAGSGGNGASGRARIEDGGDLSPRFYSKASERGGARFKAPVRMPFADISAKSVARFPHPGQEDRSFF